MIRRSFLKVGVTVGGLVLFREPLSRLLPTHHDWVEDKGDFYIVRVPEKKVFLNETLAKPTIFLLGALAAVKAVEVKGFANIFMPRGGSVEGCHFDGSKMKTDKDRPVLLLQGEGAFIYNNVVNTPPNAAIAANFRPWRPNA